MSAAVGVRVDHAGVDDRRPRRRERTGDHVRHAGAVEPRTTHDLDVVIDPSRAALTTLVAGLAAAAFYGMVAVAGATLDRTYLEPWLDALDLRATFAHATTA